MKRLFVFALFFISICLVSLFCFAKSDEGVLTELDNALRNQAIYMGEKEHKIDSLKQQLHNTSLTIDEQFLLNNDIGHEYQLFITDSAMKYFDRNMVIADKLHNKTMRDEVLINQAFVLSVSGMYKEALDLFNSIDRSQLSSHLLVSYYNCGRQIYGFLGGYSHNEEYKGEYQRMQYLYRDSLLDVLPENSFEYKLYKAEQETVEPNYAASEMMLQSLLHQVPQSSNIYARAAYSLATIYKEQGNSHLYLQYLTLSAISDVKGSVKENAALQNLALYLYKEGDINRAYQYIKYSLDDALFCNARLRTVEISTVLPVINTAYQIKVKQQQQQLLVFLILVSILSLFLIVALFWIYKQMKRLSLTERSLRQSNHIKEEYIGHFLSLCSLYIEKLDRFRSTVNRKIVAGQADDLLRLTKSSQFASNEQKEFYANFDNAFLQIYPNFVKEFNELLQPDDHFVLKAGELMNNELRIFAIIRLGIDDSSKIANFLHYSINTIYTYRNKVKNKAIDRDKFDENLMKIGAVE